MYFIAKEMIQLKNKYVKIVAIILPILVAVICLIQMVKNDNQSFLAVPMEYSFTGEYSYDGQNWYPYSEDSDISALDGEMIVKGHFDYDTHAHHSHASHAHAHLPARGAPCPIVN